MSELLSLVAPPPKGVQLAFLEGEKNIDKKCGNQSSVEWEWGGEVVINHSIS